MVWSRRVNPVSELDTVNRNSPFVPRLETIVTTDSSLESASFQLFRSRDTSSPWPLICRQDALTAQGTYLPPKCRSFCSAIRKASSCGKQERSNKAALKGMHNRLKSIMGP